MGSSKELFIDIRGLVSSARRVHAPLEYGVARAIASAQPDPVLVHTEKGEVVSNIFADRGVLYATLGAQNEQEAYTRLLEALNSPTPLKDAAEPVRATSLGDDLYKLPVPKFYERDAGPYITSGIFLAKDPETGYVNASIHRALVIGENELAVRIVPRHLYKILSRHEKRGLDMESVILVGAPPPVYIAAASSPPFGVSELEVASTLAGGLHAEKIGGLPVPLPTEIVIVGRFLAGKRAREGPFVDITGTYDEVREQPVFRVEEIRARPGAVFYAILPAGLEHINLMGFPREAAIWDVARRTSPGVKRVRLTRGGAGWLHAVIVMEKYREGDPKNVLMAAFAAHPSLKMAITVDPDIDPDDPVQVEWALATRMQPSEDIFIVPNARGSSLDPSSDQVNLLTSKIAIDATRPLGKDPRLFERARIPPGEGGGERDAQDHRI